MGALSDKKINETFDGLIKTSNEDALPVSGQDKLQDGLGNDTSLSIGRDGAGASVAGDLAVSGTVDGRDISLDGQKLDGIEAGATADQTPAEIKTAYESNADTNAFTDAEQTKLAGIEAGAEVNVTPNLDQVTTEGNTTINDIIVGSVKTELVESTANPLTISSQSGFSQMNLDASVVQTTAVNATNEYKLNSSTIVDQNENLTIKGWADIDGDLNIDGGDLTSNQVTFNLLNSGVTTVNAFSQASNVNMGVGTTEFLMSGSTEVTGGLTVDGNYNTADGNIYSTNGSLSLGSGSVSAGGSVTGSSIVKTGGASTEFLKADGTVDSTTYQDTTEKGQANGYAPLDSGAKIAEAYLPDSIVGQVEYQGTWDADTNTPTLDPLTAPKGHYYITSVAGTFDSIDYAVGDWIIADGTSWSKVDNSDAVTTVFNRSGNIVANESDYSSFYPLKADIKDSTITVTTGGGLSGSGDFTTNQATNETITIQHADTSTQGSVAGTTNTFVDGVTLDTYGHVTALTTQSVTIPNPENATITIAAGTAMSGGGDFTTNQSTNETITVNHADTSTLSGHYGGDDFTTSNIKGITVDGSGHVTGVDASQINAGSVDGALYSITDPIELPPFTDFAYGVNTSWFNSRYIRSEFNYLPVPTGRENEWFMRKTYESDDGQEKHYEYHFSNISGPSAPVFVLSASGTDGNSIGIAEDNQMRKYFQATSESWKVINDAYKLQQFDTSFYIAEPLRSDTNPNDGTSSKQLYGDDPTYITLDPYDVFSFDGTTLMKGTIKLYGKDFEIYEVTTYGT